MCRTRSLKLLLWGNCELKLTCSPLSWFFRIFYHSKQKRSLRLTPLIPFSFKEYFLGMFHATSQTSDESGPGYPVSVLLLSRLTTDSCAQTRVQVSYSGQIKPKTHLFYNANFISYLRLQLQCFSFPFLFQNPPIYSFILSFKSMASFSLIIIAHTHS